MENMEYIIRLATEDDASELLKIYGPYVLNTAITYEYEVPTEEEFKQRIRNVRRRYPYLVAESENGILGYAYVSKFHPRAAYDWCVETSIYLDANAKGKGVGRALYEKLEACMKEQNVLNMIACVAYPEEEDNYLDWNSIRFHEKMGYKLSGKFLKCGYKFGNWYGMTYLEKSLGDRVPNPKTVIPFDEIDETVRKEQLKL